MKKCASDLLRSLNYIKFVQTGMYNVMRGSKLENNMDSKNKIIIFGHKDSNKNYSFCGNYKFCIQERSYQ